MAELAGVSRIALTGHDVDPTSRIDGSPPRLRAVLDIGLTRVGVRVASG